MGNRLYKRLIESGRKEECEICHITQWCDNPIVLQVHHKDGNPKNNDFSNLQILCPNCHSQTDNYCAKNRKVEKEKFYCSCCGKEIKSRTTTGMCRDCCNKKQQEKSNCPPKEELLEKCYELKSYSKIAKEYGVSDKTISKWCNKYGFTLKDLNIKPDIKPSKKNLQAIANKYAKPVYQFDEHGKFLKEFPSLTEAERSTGVSKANIKNVIQNKRLTAGGFVWKLKYN